MNDSIKIKFRRAATVVQTLAAGAALLGGSANIATAAGNAVPTGSSNSAPQVYSSLEFHPGGGLMANSDFGQHWGTPTGTVPPIDYSTNLIPPPKPVTQINSFVLGFYAPGLPPGNVVIGTTLTSDMPNNFRDSANPSRWAAPFSFADTSNGSKVSVDDTAAAISPGWFHVTANSTPTTSTVGTASNAEYYRFGAASGGTASVVWTLTPPSAGAYSVTVHLPDSASDQTGGTLNEARITDAHYVVRINGAVVSDTRVSQASTFDNQYLAGPFALSAGDTVKVTVDNSTLKPIATNAFVLADSVGLVSGTGSEVQSTPAAINSIEFSEISNAQYYGTSVGTANNEGPLHGGGTADPFLRIRSLVYFGRAENKIVTVGGTQQIVPVGAMYCVDGFTGSVVWRFETVPVYKDPAVPSYLDVSQPVFTSPSVTHMKVAVSTDPVTRQSVIQNKLVVVFGDEGGRLYCLDATGDIVNHPNNVGSSNVDALDANGHPIFDVNAPNQNGRPGHEGGTTAYWIYRPDAANPHHQAAIVDDSSPGFSSKDAGNNPWAQRSTGPAAATAVNNEYAYTTTANAATATASWTINAPAAGSYKVLVHIPAALEPTEKRTTDARFTVVIGGSPTNVTINENTGSSYVVLAGPATLAANAPVTVSLSNQSATAGNTVVADAVALVASGADATRDLPVPESFALSSPTIFVNSGGFGTVYVTNSNGTAYAFAGTGVAFDSDPYNDSLNVGTYPGTTQQYNTIVPLWWFTLRPTGDTTSFADIESSPTILPTGSDTCKVLFGSSHEVDEGSNAGRIYEIDGQAGPIGDSGNGSNVPGSQNYNVSPRPDWSFPDGYGTSVNNATQKARPALGDVSGSPVVFTIQAGTNKGTAIYFAANSGPEVPAGGTTPVPAPDQSQTGRIWCIDTTGKFQWAFPTATDPNSAASDTTPEPSQPIGSFLHVTPAMGYVQFPSTINLGTGPAWTHADASNADIKGQSVPMLYAGTRGAADSAIYALDVDIKTDPTPATQDQNLLIYRVISPLGSIFQSSPTLVTNYSNAPNPGNGGALFQTAGDTLIQFDATPISNGNTGQAYPLVNIDMLFHTVSAYSTPAVSALDIGDIVGGTGVQDWLYIGDSTSGYCRGLSPDRAGFAFQTYLPFQVPTGASITNPEFPLHSHIYDGTPAHPANSTDLSKQNPLVGDIPVFEWGQNAYIRISDVVPPNPGGAGDDPNLHIQDPDDPDYYYTNGSAVTFSITDVDRAGNAVANSEAATIPTTIFPATSLPADGFALRTDTPGPDDPLVTIAGNKGYLACYTYAFRNGQGRQNTPGAYRRVIQARQTADRWKVGAAAPESTVTLSAVVSAGIQYNKKGKIAQTPPSVEPQFGILNPLYLKGYGIPVNQASGSSVPLSSIGPMAAHTVPLAAQDLEALGNGNWVYNSAPQDAISQTDPTSIKSFATQPAKTYRNVVATSNFINHGTTGDNKIAFGGGIAYSLFAGDRSALGELFPNVRGGINYGTDQDLHIATEERSEHWNDPTGFDPASARINPLPWDDSPLHSGFNGLNASRDYPNIFGYDIQQVLHSNKTGGDVAIGGIRSASKLTDPVIPSNDPINNPLGYTVKQSSSIQVNIGVVKYQPANLTPLVVGGNTFVNGYIARPKIFVDSNGNNRWDTGEAYREVVFTTGVPVDQKMSIVEDTVDLKKEAAGFGLNMSGFTPSGAASSVGPFSPYSPYFTQFFRPVTVHNEGNTNLYDVQFDQLLANIGGLPITSDSNDASSVIPAFDSQGLTGPRPAGELPYLLRSSIDKDLWLSYGRNPGFASVGFAPPGATLHKARPRESQPTTMTVPDVPHDNYQFYGNGVANPFYVPVALGAAPALSGGGVAYATKPYVGIAIPVGTPVGTYSQTLRAFESANPNRVWTSRPAYDGTLHGLYVAGGTPQQPYSDPGVKVKVDVIEQRITNGSQNGLLPYLDKAPSGNGGSSVNFLPSMFRDISWSGNKPQGSGNIVGLWTSQPNAATPFNIGTLTMPWVGPYPGYFNPASTNNSWFFGSAASGLNAGSNLAASVFQEQPGYDDINDQWNSSGNAYALYTSVNGATNQLYVTQLTPSTGQPTGPQVRVASNLTLPKFGAHGLTTGSKVWAFWYSGNRGRTSIYYASGATGAGGQLPSILSAYSGPGAPSEARLPIPSGLSSVQDPTAISTFAPYEHTQLTKIIGGDSAIEVTYSGTNTDGNADIYVSRYLEYNPLLPNGSTDSGSFLLKLLPMPNIKEVLRPDYINNWWQARDVGWQREVDGGTVNVFVGYPGQAEQPLLYNPANGKALFTGNRGMPIFDKATRTEVFTGVTIPGTGGSSFSNQVVYVDVDRGRVRFGVPLVKNSFPIVTAEFNATARRITTDTRADTQPSVVFDDSFKENDGGFANAANPGNGVGRPFTSRYYYFWRKTGTSTNSTTPTIYFTTQRLTGVLDLGNGAIPIPLNAKQQPACVVTDVTAGVNTVLYDAADPAAAQVDLDWSRGRIYFSSQYEGRLIRIDVRVQGKATAVFVVPHWLQEPRYNDTLASLSDAPGNAGTVGVDRISANDAGETPVLMDTSINESGVSAFLDPLAYGDDRNAAKSLGAPHKVWLFWSSTRNGKADLYFETIHPRFTPTPQ